MMRESAPKILLVDDDQDDHFFMKTVINEFNPYMEVRSVYNGVEALDFLLNKGDYINNDFAPDLILTDVNMPILNGLEFLKDLKKNPVLKDLPVFIISTSKNAQLEKEYIKHGAVKYYLKPISTSDLKGIISDVLVQSGLTA
ncbi:MAG: response regulator [Bacteroidetes bacterium]|nr:response regulator [Bacteroidota bacterium]